VSAITRQGRLRPGHDKRASEIHATRETLNSEDEVVHAGMPAGTRNLETVMGKDGLEFTCIKSLDELAGYLVSIADGLTQGGLNLRFGDRVLRLTPGADVEIQLKERKGRIDLKIGWKQRTTTPVSALRVSVGPGAV
jgi:amphi-Trp domain-containing protein